MVEGISEILKQRRTDGEYCNIYRCRYYSKRAISGASYCNLFNTTCKEETCKETRVSVCSEGKKLTLNNTKVYRAVACISLDRVNHPTAKAGSLQEP
jgi:CRISPR/Cas system-associated protein Cas7 (RAMP superfamily)